MKLKQSCDTNYVYYIAIHRHVVDLKLAIFYLLVITVVGYQVVLYLSMKHALDLINYYYILN